MSSTKSVPRLALLQPAQKGLGFQAKPVRSFQTSAAK